MIRACGCCDHASAWNEAAWFCAEHTVWCSDCGAVLQWPPIDELPPVHPLRFIHPRSSGPCALEARGVWTSEQTTAWMRRIDEHEMRQLDEPELLGVDRSLHGPLCVCGHHRLSHWGSCSARGCRCALYRDARERDELLQLILSGMSPEGRAVLERVLRLLRRARSQRTTDPT